MFHSRHINHNINKHHERALRIVYNDHFLSFEELLKTNLSQLIKETCKYLLLRCIKILNGLSPDIMQDIFETKSNYYNTRNAPAFSSRNIKTVRYGLQTISYMAPKIWDLVPKEMKQFTTLNEFRPKSKSGSWKTVPADSVELTFRR